MKHPKQKEIDDFLRESNAIEGVYDSISLKQANRAWQYLMSKDELTSGVVLKTHKILMLHQNLFPNEKGYFRTVDVWIGGHKGSNPASVSFLIEMWVSVANVVKTENEIKDSHINYEGIHPFVDGNGRTGRLFLNWCRMKNKLPILIIKESEKSEYYKWFRE